MTIPFPPMVPTGWVCPKCGRVYAPTCPACFHCGPSNAVYVPNADPPSMPPGWVPVASNPDERPLKWETP